MNPDQKKLIQKYLDTEYFECTGPSCPHETTSRHYILVLEDFMPLISALITQAVQAERQRLLEAIGEDEPTTEDWLETGDLLNTRTHARNELRAVLREALNQENES